MSESIQPAPEHPRPASNQIRGELPPAAEPLRSCLLEEEPAEAPPRAPVVSLVGRTARERRGFPLFAVLLLALVPVPLVFALIKKERGLAALAVLPLCSGALLLCRRRPLVVTFGEEEMDFGGMPIRYDDIDGVYSAGRSERAFSIHLTSGSRRLRIPARMDCPSDSIFPFLRAACPPDSRERSVPRALQSFRAWQEKLFGPDQVGLYHARPAMTSGFTSATRFCLGLAVAGLIWSIGWNWWGGSWGGAGIGLLFIAALFALLFWLGMRPHPGLSVKQRDQACLIASPGGMALVQGQLKGELKWTEVADVALKSRGIRIKVAGALIEIFDIYNDSLAQIYARIRHDWLRRNDHR